MRLVIYDYLYLMLCKIINSSSRKQNWMWILLTGSTTAPLFFIAIKQLKHQHQKHYHQLLYLILKVRLSDLLTLCTTQSLSKPLHPHSIGGDGGNRTRVQKSFITLCFTAIKYNNIDIMFQCQYPKDNVVDLAILTLV